MKVRFSHASSAAGTSKNTPSLELPRARGSTRLTLGWETRMLAGLTVK